MQNNTIPQPSQSSHSSTDPNAGQLPPVMHTPHHVPVTKSKPKNEGWRSVFSTLAILIAAPLIALFLTTFVFQSYEVDGPSMLPTLVDNDRLIVLKTGKTWASLTGKDYVPARGEIIVFHRKGLYSFNADLDKQLIKRVIALPGERVVVNNGIIVVFNSEHPEGFQPDQEAPYGDHIITTPGNAEFTVGEGQVFVSGDNRPNSLDSRDFGPIDSEDIVGTLALRIYPFSDFESF